MRIPLKKIWYLSKVKKIKISDLGECMQKLVIEYIRKYKEEGTDFPKITLEYNRKSKMFDIIDGHNRMVAAKIIGLKDINAKIVNWNL